ncbi:NapH/MauN family ferredoxin-type protein [Cytobacillus spongiae]|uniref:NapH/MauN family ferredoxin-type protein n=1 Tax=Cytobacillus spongiae TaxID=2901381 RepID=UPI001F38C7A6|nr:NapH/MauN family ferredoxin-type protein [Cytobacillus spongiae]UII54267.1 NapH/MauN family ferredoxin-type protein [Cytobacillus spongiae]
MMAQKRQFSKKWTIARRAVQLLVIVLFLSPVIVAEIEGEPFFFGSLASSSFLGIVLSDPFAALQIIAASKIIHWTYLGGACIIFIFYTVIRGRVFCSWVCPVNTLLEGVDKIRSYVPLPDQPMNRRLKVYLAAVILILSFFTGVPVFELISPIAILMRNLLFIIGIGGWFLLAILIMEVFISRRGWCRSLCPLGGFYQSIGRFGRFQVQINHEQCTGCDVCRAVCLADPIILEPAITRESEFVIAGDCSLCGECVDHCPFQAITIEKKKNRLFTDVKVDLTNFQKENRI